MRAGTVWFGIGVLVTLVVSRWALAPRYLYYFDNINFALALDRFDPSAHQPQPPGYALFVLLARIIHTVSPGARETFLIAGLLGAAAALVLLWLLARAMFVRRAAVFAVLSLLPLPAFWVGGITHQVRIFLAAGALGVALCCWRAVQPGTPARWFPGAAAALGIAAGFRPDVLICFAPLLVYAGLRRRARWREWLGAGTAFAAAVALWLPYTIAASGGLAKYIELIRSYSSDEFQGSSALFGAAAPSAWRMARMAFVWTGLGVLAWIWAVPSAWKNGAYRGRADAWIFLLVLFAPAYLFLSVIHVGDPDQTLIAAPALVLLAGWTLAGFATTERRTAIAATAVLLLNCAVFLRPPRGIASASGYPAARKVDEQTHAAFEAVRQLTGERATVLVSFRSLVTYRHLSYYFPEIPLLVLRDDPRDGGQPKRTWLLRNMAVQNGPGENPGVVAVLGPVRLVWFLPPDPSWRHLVQPPTEPGVHPPVLYTDLDPGEEVRFGGYRIAAAGRGTE